LSKNIEITEGEATSVTSSSDLDKAVEISPLTLDKTFSRDENMYDFRPLVVESGRVDVDPKASSAAEPADSSPSKTIAVSESQHPQEKVVPVEKDSGKPKA